ncbi:hypothetical protein C3747_90g99 [Trypanosoma cruzi]|uniref:Trypanosoma Tc-38 (p38) protein domain-containing protein n=2 Tax=Trypanosoma cruzi TaxID=5693 RepID=Q4DPM9_TRYCC|nr:hypothetical protein, conserved [Trypanosoma cruzi]EAN94477.1 hypothetical protein, conserved [Trypanosoma cruzi]PWV08444.1 hypothetical protein C3747_90g99 [Trypanosoma cruzi]RNC61977.1 hypothetical protein TcCL_ESM00369 [Trypanosoma cruzi]|eukprot:XP_816328.1 hypothetical protein [Trypanosoma cruzi strain CL Brener]
MFTPTRTRLSAVFATSILWAASRSTRVEKKNKKAPELTSARDVGSTTVAKPHVAVFTTMKDSLDNILGGSAVPRDAGPVANCRAHEEETAPSTEAEKFPKNEETKIEEENVAAKHEMPSYYKPMNTHEQLYDAEVAQRLCVAAASRHFRSPVWSTRTAFTRFGYTVKDGEEGVDISTMMQTVKLYNLEQTSAPDASVSASLKCSGKTLPEWRNVPMSAAGRPHSRHVQRTLQEHPSYAQYTAPYWITEEEAALLGTAVRPSQRGCGILIKRPSAATRLPASGEKESRPVSQESTSRPEEDFFMLYNAAQLEAPELVTRETCPPLLFLSVDGHRYNVFLSLHMRKYCQKYNLNMQPMVVFITASRLRSLGGDLRPMENDVPPFTCVINDEIVSFHHGEHTTISEKLSQKAMALRRERFDRAPASNV